ncbi:SgcJ/EcaC family oxidoreductase [Microlunatus sp. GCM10028923]|uniref:SgcJ/EcaC family oxidoreductase n=1 Tax=Microlunatus sp. GCM10028923 TaxID=3273400 RepID=UPI003616C67B
MIMNISTVDPDTEAADLAAIKDLIATIEHAQNNELPEPFLELFRPDAIWTTGGGHRLFGRDAIAAFTRKVLPGGMQGMTQTFELEHVLYLRPDVVAVKVRQVYRTEQGSDVGSPLWVMTKEDGAWRLAACQNTGVLDDEDVSPNRPVFGSS